MEQETLIYIDERDRHNASAGAKIFANKETKNRAYTNLLGAELINKYLKSEEIDTSECKNLHSIKKILEELDISDIKLPNIHLDVRIVFDENAIFIPKSHFDYNITPDIYVVLLLEDSRTKFLGFFEPRLVNRNNTNGKYYFIEKEKLSSPLDLITYIRSHNEQKDSSISFETIEKSEMIMVSMADNDISENDKRFILENLKKNSHLRDAFIEFENFEHLSYKLMNDPQIEKPVVDITPSGNYDEPLEQMDSEQIVWPAEDELTDQTDLLIDQLDETNLAEFLANSVDDNNSFEIIDETIPTIAAATGISAGADAAINEIGGEIAGEIFDQNFDLDLPLEELDFNNNIEALNNISTEENILDNNETIIENSDEISEVNTDFVDIDNLGQTDEISEISDFSGETVDINDLEHNEVPDENIIDTIDTQNIDEISLDNITLDEIKEQNIEDNQEIQPIDNISLDNITLDEIKEQNIENSAEIHPIDEISLDNITLDEIKEQNIEDNQEIQPIDDISLDNITLDEIKEQNIEDNSNIQSSDEISIADINLDEDFIENNGTTEAFGKNLLDNLSAEESISIEDMPVQNNSIEIDSDDMLQQIDNVLNSATQLNETEEIPEINEITEEVSNTTENETISSNDYMEDLLNSDDAINIEDPDKLNLLFSENNNPQENVPENIDELTNIETPAIPGAAITNNQKQLSNKTIIISAAVLALIAAGSAFYFLKPKEEPANEFETVPNVETSVPPIAEEIPENNVLNTNTPINTEKPKITQENIQAEKQAVQELKSNAPAKKISSAYMSISKLVWDVPNTLSYSPKIQNYLRTAGKSIKISLSTDLLLTNEYAYTDHVKVGLVISKNGSIQSSKIVHSSGSKQIDDIVLQSVNQTLNVIKPPSEDIKDPNFNLNLIIYF